MASAPARRRIDWNVILDSNVPRPRIVEPSRPSPELATLISAALEDPSPAVADRVLCQAVEFARATIRLERVGIFLVDEGIGAMVGTWGTGDEGQTVDEHDVMFALGGVEQEVFERSQHGFLWTVYEDCPLITQSNNETRILGRGWVGCTPIRGASGPVGLLFNDTALTGAPIDEMKQARAAMLCSLLGPALESCGRVGTRSTLASSEGEAEMDDAHPVVRRVTKLLAADPTLSCDALAERLHLSAGWLARTFKREAKTSLVDHRNELRLARFLDRVDGPAHNLLEAALDAGFGSYAQFHRVFRARFGKTPGDYLLERRADSQAPAAGPSDANTEEASSASKMRASRRGK